MLCDMCQIQWSGPDRDVGVAVLPADVEGGRVYFCVMYVDTRHGSYNQAFMRLKGARI